MSHGECGAPDRVCVGGTGGGDRRDRDRLVAGERLGVASIVGEIHLYLDGLAVVGRGQRVGAACCSRDVAARPEPLVGVAGGGQAVGVHDVRGPSRQRHADLRGAGDSRLAGGGVVGGVVVGDGAGEVYGGGGGISVVAAGGVVIPTYGDRLAALCGVSSVMVMSRLAWVSPAGTVIRASPPEMKLT